MYVYFKTNIKMKVEKCYILPKLLHNHSLIPLSIPYPQPPLELNIF